MSRADPKDVEVESVLKVSTSMEADQTSLQDAGSWTTS
jgi:hypothetical protein